MVSWLGPGNINTNAKDSPASSLNIDSSMLLRHFWPAESTNSSRQRSQRREHHLESRCSSQAEILSACLAIDATAQLYLWIVLNQDKSCLCGTTSHDDDSHRYRNDQGHQSIRIEALQTIASNCSAPAEGGALLRNPYRSTLRKPLYGIHEAL